MTAPESPLRPFPANQRSCSTLVVGAGIVGVATALRLQREGRDVWLIDRERVAAQASRGNAGALAFSDILPLASAGILRQAPRWLLDPLGPLTIRPSYLPRLVPWLLRFWHASRRARVRASTAAQAALMTLSTAETPLMLEAAGASHMLRSEGVLHLYESEAELQASQAGWQARAEHGIAFTHLHGAQSIAPFQPGLSAAIVAATFVPAWSTVSDPLIALCTLLGSLAPSRWNSPSAVSTRPSAISTRALKALKTALMLAALADALATGTRPTAAHAITPASSRCPLHHTEPLRGLTIQNCSNVTLVLDIPHGRKGNG